MYIEGWMDTVRTGFHGYPKKGMFDFFSKRADPKATIFLFQHPVHKSRDSSVCQNTVSRVLHNVAVGHYEKR